MISKVYFKISVSFGLVQNLEIWDFTMAKVERVNIAVTYLEAYAMLVIACLHLGWHAKCCTVACKNLKTMHSANTARCMTPMLLFIVWHSAGNTN
jgi:hypothetical protein